MNLPEVVKTAVAVRRDMPETALTNLSPVERGIWDASTKRAISEYPLEELSGHVGKLAKAIAMDAGIKTIDPYSVTRFMDILRKYYYTMSLSEVKIAFELGMTGQLDEYLPRDKYGMADCHHYQSFSVEYVTKILNAYKKRFADVQAKAYAAIPEKKKEWTEQEKIYYSDYSRRLVRSAYLQYKYRGKINPVINDLLIYSELERMGYAEPIRVTESDRKQGYAALTNKHHNGLINDFIASCIRAHGTNNGMVNDEAFRIAKMRAIRETFDYMIKNEISI